MGFLTPILLSLELLPFAVILDIALGWYREQVPIFSTSVIYSLVTLNAEEQRGVRNDDDGARTEDGN